MFAEFVGSFGKMLLLLFIVCVLSFSFFWVAIPILSLAMIKASYTLTSLWARMVLTSLLVRIRMQLLLRPYNWIFSGSADPSKVISTVSGYSFYFSSLLVDCSSVQPLFSL